MASADQTLDESLKILVIGDSDVGKTSLVFRFVDGSFSSQFVPTVGIDFKSKTIVWNDKRIQLQIWDTAGQERYRSITTSYFRGAAGFVIMYDIRNEVSFNGVQEWVSQIKTYSGPEAKKILVGNMTDEEKEREVTIKKGQQLADKLGIEFIETSVKNNSNVEKVFEILVGSILKAKTPPTKPETTKLFDKSVSTAKDSWCYC
ncbi:PREDICTED: ras-related protein Rab-3-like isoform X1 [Acropora digitifera]|uniref:ras-related protein Rab-3-like isoform X1 n=1 Tax=Acropora digitifera TaxID=70779 RepID=UPI00077A279E|nr:PREDICTED: ras-related protein Rab-3-like isoform X1 [Acropora digitifera]